MNFESVTQPENNREKKVGKTLHSRDMEAVHSNTGTGVRRSPLFFLDNARKRRQRRSGTVVDAALPRPRKSVDGDLVVGVCRISLLFESQNSKCKGGVALASRLNTCCGAHPDLLSSALHVERSGLVPSGLLLLQRHSDNVAEGHVQVRPSNLNAGSSFWTLRRCGGGARAHCCDACSAPSTATASWQLSAESSCAEPEFSSALQMELEGGNLAEGWVQTQLKFFKFATPISCGLNCSCRWRTGGR